MPLLYQCLWPSLDVELDVCGLSVLRGSSCTFRRLKALRRQRGAQARAALLDDVCWAREAVIWSLEPGIRAREAGIWAREAGIWDLGPVVGILGEENSA